MRTEIGAQMETPRKVWRAMIFSSAVTIDGNKRIESKKRSVAAAAAAAAARGCTRSSTIVAARPPDGAEIALARKKPRPLNRKRRGEEQWER
jgi:hypothetical protein